MQLNLRRDWKHTSQLDDLIALDHDEVGLKASSNTPVKYCANEADGAHDLAAHPHSVALDYAIGQLAHQAHIVVEQAPMTQGTRGDGVTGIEVQSFNGRARRRGGSGHD
jgi:hypothetical protein